MTSTLVLYALYALVGLFIVSGFVALFSGPGGKGTPFVPTFRKRVAAMVRLSKASQSERMVDLGSGDGRIVIAFARAGIEAHGYEINPVLVWYSRALIYAMGLQGRAHVHFKNFWAEDLSRFDVVAVFGLRPMMGALEAKLVRELRPGARIVSNNLQFPTRTFTQKEEGVYMYLI